MNKNEIYETAKNMAVEQVLNMYCSKDDPNRPALKQLLENLLDYFMLSERSVYLAKNENDKGNGFYDRKLATPVGSLEISVPRTRTGNFRPSILPDRYKRVDSSYIDLLMSLVVNGYSESSLVQTLKALNLPYSENEILKIKEDLKNELQLFKQRELPTSAFALIIDGYHCEVKDNSKVKQATCYVVLGIDLEGKKDIFGIYTFFGKENKADWMKVFDDLITRGSIIITTNKVFEEWPRIFYDPVLATAILDRFVHHCHFVIIKGESYRMKQREGAIKALADDSKNESNQLDNDN